MTTHLDDWLDGRGEADGADPAVALAPERASWERMRDVVLEIEAILHRHAERTGALAAAVGADLAEDLRLEILAALRGLDAPSRRREP